VEWQNDDILAYASTAHNWFPVKDEISVDVKLCGRKTLTIEHRIDSINDAKILVTGPRGGPTVEFAAATLARLHIRPATGMSSF
jgi:hypothetical protein